MMMMMMMQTNLVRGPVLLARAEGDDLVAKSSEAVRIDHAD